MSGTHHYSFGRLGGPAVRRVSAQAYRGMLSGVLQVIVRVEETVRFSDSHSYLSTADVRVTTAARIDPDGRVLQVVAYLVEGGKTVDVPVRIGIAYLLDEQGYVLSTVDFDFRERNKDFSWRIFFLQPSQQVPLLVKVRMVLIDSRIIEGYAQVRVDDKKLKLPKNKMERSFQEKTFEIDSGEDRGED